LISRRKKNWIDYILRDKSLREVIEGRTIGKRPRGRKRFGKLNEFFERSVVCGIKEKGRKQERMENMEGWKPRTCLTSEH